MGRLSPLSGVGPEDLRIAALSTRAQNGAISEIVLATSPTIEGDTTAHYIVSQLKIANPSIKATRLARGVPEGSDLSFAQSGTIGEALKSRVAMESKP